MSRSESPRQGLPVDGRIVRNAARRSGDRLRSVEPQPAAVVAHLAHVGTGQGEAHVPKPLRVTTVVRVGTVRAAPKA